MGRYEITGAPGGRWAVWDAWAVDPSLRIFATRGEAEEWVEENDDG